ncbi:AcrR family transcriptional regulator [Actinoplanes octamycinicus]|uniref:AcrR family transcriptional regulator n=1 Tax=Actinoplanes octamycinicus TaxID=135948 RepID=A0A7W7GYH1_9ACTN|nr:TetR/AcrR family transcriptional regulator [Actinoplanes octamycinicus]MBB4740467.1 AcrR family transcriptional regulator [Actinoplanes octamycinicus]
MNTRDRIVSAAAEVMHDRGLARATTKEIARAAGLSEAALYKHFRDKIDLFLAVLGERGPTQLGTVVARLAERAGADPLDQVLREVVRAATDFYQQSFPIAASIFSERTLFEAHRAALHERGAGPHKPGRALAAYLADEQRRGRLHPAADPAAASSMILGACLERAFLGHFAEHPTDPDEFATTLVRTLLTGLAPAQPPTQATPGRQPGQAEPRE